MPTSRLRLLPGPNSAPKRIPNRTSSVFSGHPIPPPAHEFIRAIDLFGEVPVRQCMDSSYEAVWAALASDWETVGRDFWNAMARYEYDAGLDFLKLEETTDVK